MKTQVLAFVLSACLLPAHAQVKLLFPRNNETLTDIAVSFKAEIKNPNPKLFFLYVSKNKNFTGNVIKRPAQTGKGTVKFNHHYFLTYQGKVTPNDKFLLTPGKWYWRVSGDGGKTYSATRTLNVVGYKPRKPPTRVVGVDKPLFHMRLRSGVADGAKNGDVAAALRKMVPDELKEYVVLDIGQSFHFLAKGRSLYEFSKIFDDLGYKYFFDVGSHAWLGRIASLGEMERVFRDLKHCQGAAAAEIFYYIYNNEAERSMFDGIFELCRKYGKVFLHSDMNWRWSGWHRFSKAYYDIFQQRGYGDYYLPQFKTTDPWGTNVAVSTLQGMKLSGMVDNIGIWADWWSWADFGTLGKFGVDSGPPASEVIKSYPFIQNMKYYIYGMTYGATTFGLEANLQWHGSTGEPNDNHYRYLLPFLRAVTREKIIPSNKALNKNLKVAVDTEIKGSVKDFPAITFNDGNIWGDFMKST